MSSAALWTRLDEAHAAEPLPGTRQNAALTAAVFDWLADRMVQDDTLTELRRVLPGVPDEVLFTVIGAVCRVVRQP